MNRRASPIDAVAMLSEPTRRALYAFVSRAAGAVSRDDAAAATGTARPLTAFHLDKLVDAGLLATEFRRISGRSGPGAGRPSKLYRRAEGDVAVSLPPRSYDLAGHLFAEAIGTSKSRAAKQALTRTARAHGRRLGESAAHQPGTAHREPRTAPREPRTAPRAVSSRRTVLAALEQQGFEPARQSDGTIRLRNCPFHALVADHRDLVCGMNLAMLTGLLEGLGEGGGGEQYEAMLAPEPGYCCVAFRKRNR